MCLSGVLRSDAFAELFEECIAVSNIALRIHDGVPTFCVVYKRDYGLSVGAQVVDILILLAFDVDPFDAEGAGACVYVVVQLSCTRIALVVKRNVRVFAFSCDCRQTLLRKVARGSVQHRRRFGVAVFAIHQAETCVLTGGVVAQGDTMLEIDG